MDTSAQIKAHIIALRTAREAAYEAERWLDTHAQSLGYFGGHALAHATTAYDSLGGAVFALHDALAALREQPQEAADAR